MAKEILIPTESHLSGDKFISDYLLKGLPVVIKESINHWPALQWTLDGLQDVAGHRPVLVRTNTNCHDYKQGVKYNIRQTTFGDYIKDLLQGKKSSFNSYLAVQNVKKALPELLNDIEVPPFVEKVHGGPYLWIAPHQHYEYCHFDPDDGLLIVLSGQKKVRLYGCDPEPLYPNVLGSKGRTVQSQVDCDTPDFSVHPKFEQVQCHTCTLNAGEMLYIPAFWWHQVTSYDQTISINIFWGNGGENTYLEKVMNAPYDKAFYHWLLNIIEQNKACPSFERILSRLPEALSNFLHNQWHEFATKEQLDILTEKVMAHLDIKKLPDKANTAKNPTPLLIRGLLWRD